MKPYKIGKIYLDSVGAINLITTSKGKHNIYWQNNQNISICYYNRLFVFHEDILKEDNAKAVEYESL